MADSLKDKVIEIIASQAVLEPSDISLDDNLAALDLDSLALVEAIFAIEEEFGVSVPFNANDPSQSDFDISSVASIIKAVEALVRGQEA